MSTFKNLDPTGLQYYSNKIKEKINEKLTLVSLTEAEYNELSEADKNKADTIYEIRDYDESEGGGSIDDIVTISDVEIVEGSDIDTPIYYYQPSPEDIEEEKLFFQDQNGKAVEVPFVAKEPQTISLSKNSVSLNMLNATDTITVTADGEISVTSTDTSVAIVSISNGIITIIMVETGECQINVVANATKTKASASAIINISANTDIIITTTPTFNANNFTLLDTTAIRKYYFGQYGNAFYGVSDGLITAIPGGPDPEDTSIDLGQASGEVPYWELVDTDANINRTSLSSTWGPDNNGQTILNYTNGLKDTYFSLADQMAMKSAGSDINTKDVSSSGAGSISASEAFLWPLSYKQLNVNEILRRALYAGAGSNYIWTRSYCGYNNYHKFHYAWYFDNSIGYLNNAVTDAIRVAPAFNLNLTKVLLPKSALSDDTISTLTDISIKVSEDVKFLINAGTAKSDFIINTIGSYNVTEITSLNNGTNYISYIVYDSDGLSLYYGNIMELTETSGSIDIEAEILNNLELNPGTYTLAVFQEEKCDAYKTDYASDPTYFAFTIS